MLYRGTYSPASLGITPPAFRPHSSIHLPTNDVLGNRPAGVQYYNRMVLPRAGHAGPSFQVSNEVLERRERGAGKHIEVQQCNVTLDLRHVVK